MTQRIFSVLIVDDESLERVLLRNGYEWNKHGFRIIGEAGSARQALDFLERNEADFVLTDINMPQVDGLAFVEAAMKRFPEYTTQFIIVTGYRDFEYARQAVKLGVKEFLLKPINFSELEETLCKLKIQIVKTENEQKILKRLRRIVETDSAGGKELFFKLLADYEKLPADLPAPANANLLPPKDFPWDDLIFSLEHGLNNKTSGSIDLYCAFMRVSCGENPYLLKLSSVYFLSKAEQVLLKAGSSFADAPSFSDLWQRLDEIFKVDDAKKFLTAFAEKITFFCKNSRPRVFNPLIEKSLQVINDYLCDPDLSLTFVAQRVFANASYLSRLFKQNTGKTFSNYILARRMEKAIKLIGSSDVKVYEIAERVGILDPHYFSLCFKRFTGINITDYKNR